MIYSIHGTVARVAESFAVIEAAGVGYRVLMGKRSLASLIPGSEAKVFTRLVPGEDAFELFGFADERSLEFFGRLVGVSGVGPRSAMALLDATPCHELAAAIEENRPDLVAAPGIGRKIAERIVVELRGKVGEFAETGATGRMDADADILEALVSLGYRKEQAANALRDVAKDIVGTEERLKAALGALGKRK